MVATCEITLLLETEQQSAGNDTNIDPSSSCSCSQLTILLVYTFPWWNNLVRCWSDGWFWNDLALDVFSGLWRACALLRVFSVTCSENIHKSSNWSQCLPPKFVDLKFSHQYCNKCLLSIQHYWYGGIFLESEVKVSSILKACNREIYRDNACRTLHLPNLICWTCGKRLIYYLHLQ